MQLAWSRIWTRVAVSISYDDNHYTTGTFKLMPPVKGNNFLTIRARRNVYVLSTTFFLYLMAYQLFLGYLIQGYLEYELDWSTNSRTTIPQSNALTITPRGHPRCIQ